MNLSILIVDLITLIGVLVAWSFVFGIWHMVRSPSRLVLLLTLTYMMAWRVFLTIAEADYTVGWL